MDEGNGQDAAATSLQTGSRPISPGAAMRILLASGPESSAAAVPAHDTQLQRGLDQCIPQDSGFRRTASLPEESPSALNVAAGNMDLQRTVSTGALDKKQSSIWSRVSSALGNIVTKGKAAERFATENLAERGPPEEETPPGIAIDKPHQGPQDPAAETHAFNRPRSLPAAPKRNPWNLLRQTVLSSKSGVGQVFARTASAPSEGIAQQNKGQAFDNRALFARAQEAEAKKKVATHAQQEVDLLVGVSMSEEIRKEQFGRAKSVPAETRRPWSIVRSAVKKGMAALNFTRTASDGNGSSHGQESREEQVMAYLRTQQEVQIRLILRQEHAAQVLQRSFRCHCARTVYKAERYDQLEWPANLIVGNVKIFIARRLVRHYKRIFPSVVLLKSNMRCMIARRRLQLLEFMKFHPRLYKKISGEITQTLIAEIFEPTCVKITTSWASNVLGHSCRCHLARREFWKRFDLIEKLEKDIAYEMTAPVLIRGMAASLVCAEKNAAVATLQSYLRVPKAQIHRMEMKEYDDFVYECATMIQCAFRCFRAQNKVLMWDTPKCHSAALVLQLAYRCCLDREKLRERKAEFEQQTEASIQIQTVSRVWLAKRRYATRELDVEWPPTFAISSHAALTLQRVYRGHEARDVLRSYLFSTFILMNSELEVIRRAAASKLQKAWRCNLARKRYALVIHKSYDLLVQRVRNKHRAVREPKYESLVIMDEAEKAEDETEGSDEELDSDGRSSTSSFRFQLHVAKLGYGAAQAAEIVQAVYKAHLVRSKIRKQWGWDHREVSQALMMQWHRKQASKKMQSWWRVQLERKKFLEARRERIRKKQEVEDSFLADPNLRRVLLLNKETRVRLTAVEESHGTKVPVEMDRGAEIWSQVFDGKPAVWRVYRDDNKVLCRVIILTVHTPRDKILKISSTVAGIKPSLICTPGWVPPFEENKKKTSSDPLVAENGLSLTTLLRMAARAGPNPSGFEARDYTQRPKVILEEPSLHGDILAKEKGGVKIKWKSSAGITSFLTDDGVEKVHSVELMLLCEGEEYLQIAREIPNSGFYSWQVPSTVNQSNVYKEGVWLRGGTETLDNFEKRLHMQRSLRDTNGNIVKRLEMMKFLEPEFQIRVRVKTLYNGKIPLPWNGPDYIESTSPHFFVVQRPPQGEERRSKPNASIGMLFPRGRDLLWIVGTQQTIKWKTQGFVHSVRVSLVLDGVEMATIAESMLNVGVLIYIMPNNMPPGDNYQVRVRSKQNFSVVVDSSFFRVVDRSLGASQSTFSVSGGMTTSLNKKPLLEQTRKNLLPTRKAFGEEPRHVGALRPLDLQLDRTDGTRLSRVPDFVKVKRTWDQGRGPDNFLSSFLDRPEVKMANDRDLFETFRPRTGPDKLDEWSKEQEDLYNKWRQQKIKKVMQDSGIEGEIRDWKDLMQDWEAHNDPEIARAIAKEKEMAERELASAQSLDLWEMMRQRYKSDRLQDSLEERARVGAAAQIEELRVKEAAEAAAKEKSKADEVKRRASRDAARQSAKFLFPETLSTIQRDMHEASQRMQKMGLPASASHFRLQGLHADLLKGKKVRATPAPDKPYNLQQGNEWQAIDRQAFVETSGRHEPMAWNPVKDVNTALPQAFDHEFQHHEREYPVRSPASSALLGVYKKPLPGTRALGAGLKSIRRSSPRLRSAEERDDTSTGLPSVRPQTALSLEDSGPQRPVSSLTIQSVSIGDSSRLGTATSGANNSEIALQDIPHPASAELSSLADTRVDELALTQDSTLAQDDDGRLSTTGSAGSSIASKGALGLKQSEEKTSKSGMLAAVWAKKTLRRSRAETKEQAVFKAAQNQNFQPIKHRRLELFDYQAEKLRVASRMSPSLYGKKESSDDFPFKQSWVHAERSRQAHFMNYVPGDMQGEIFDRIEIDEDRLLDIDTSVDSCSRPCRLDFDPIRMLGDADDKLDPLKAQQRAQSNEKRRRAMESRAKSRAQGRAKSSQSRDVGIR